MSQLLHLHTVQNKRTLSVSQATLSAWFDCYFYLMLLSKSFAFFLKINQLSSLIYLLLGELSKQDRQKIMTICTIDVHSRDVVARLIHSKVDTSTAFQWQSQLRHRYHVCITGMIWNALSFRDNQPALRRLLHPRCDKYVTNLINTYQNVPKTNR